MPKCFWNVSPTRVLSVFGNGVAPCDCHRERPLKYPTHNVRTTTSTLHIHLSPVIKSIRVECTSCGKEKLTNVEHLEITEANFNPY